VQAVYNYYQTAKLANKRKIDKIMQPYRMCLKKSENELAIFDFGEYNTLSQNVQTGMTPEKFQSNIRRFLRKAKHPRFKKLYRELVYRPMLELLDFLRENEFQIYLCSGGDVDFLRTISNELYHIPPPKVIGSNWSYKIEGEGENLKIVRKQPSAPENIKEIKVTNIHTRIGMIPILAVGNSDGDLQMLEYCDSRQKITLQLLIKHDDQNREYAYDYGAEEIQKKAKEFGWTVISMDRDFKKVF
jgi:hypothetical protein